MNLSSTPTSLSLENVTWGFPETSASSKFVGRLVFRKTTVRRHFAWHFDKNLMIDCSVWLRGNPEYSTSLANPVNRRTGKPRKSGEPANLRAGKSASSATDGNLQAPHPMQTRHIRCPPHVRCGFSAVWQRFGCNLARLHSKPYTFCPETLRALPSNHTLQFVYYQMKSTFYPILDGHSMIALPYDDHSLRHIGFGILAFRSLRQTSAMRVRRCAAKEFCIVRQARQKTTRVASCKRVLVSFGTDSRARS